MKTFQPSPELQFALGQAENGGATMVEQFNRPLEEQGVVQKGIEGPAGKADRDISDATVRAVGTILGQKVVSEEGATTPLDLQKYLAEYGQDGWYLDSLDGTSNYLEALDQTDPALRRTIATFCLGLVIGGKARLGVNHLPLLGEPRTYAGETDQGSWRRIGNGAWVPMEAPTAEEGALLVSTNPHPHLDRLARDKRFHLVGVDGMAAKIAAFLDPELLEEYRPGLVPEGMPIVGVLSNSAKAHDFTSSIPFVDEAGGLIRTIHGDEQITFGPGKLGIAVASTQSVMNALVDAANYEHSVHRAHRE